MQDIALLDARRGVTMFNKIAVPNLGIVENMSYHQCKSCGHKEFVFGEDGALRTAKDLNMEVLGQVGPHAWDSPKIPRALGGLNSLH